MLLGNQITSATLAQLCRMLRLGLDAGLPIVRVFRQQADRGPLSMRPLLGRIAEKLADGDSLAEALAPEKDRLPPLFTALLVVGEETGNIGETLRELEEFFDQQHTLRRQFRTAIAWPTFELVAAIGVITVFLLALGWFQIQMDPLGLGTGVVGALRWLTIVFVLAVIGYLIYTGVAKQVRFLAPVEKFVLAIPALGPTLRCILLSRFCIGVKLSLGAGLPVKRALELSFDATASAYFRNSFEHAKKGIKRGETVSEILSRCPVFPQDLLDIVATGEEAGSLPEALGKQAVNYQEEAALRLKLLTQALAWLVYGMIAVLIIYMIFRIFTIGYLGPINRLLEGK